MSETTLTGGALPITIRDATKSYGAVFALDNVDLDVRSGEFMTLLGPSGSGKTTLLMVLAGFTRPDYGSVKFGEREIVRTPPHKRDVGMVFQNYALFPHMSVAANVAFPLKLRGVSKQEMVERTEQALETVQLAGYGERRIDQLSGGQRQRVALARAIVFEPRILLMDEPLSALDKKLREQMQIELRRLHDKLGMTTVYVTHDQREALTMSDRIAVINHGRVMQLGTPEEIYERPANRFVADFIGESTFLPVTVQQGVARFGDQSLKVAQMPEAGEDLLLMLRPERLQLITNDSEAADGEANRFEARVREMVYQGDSFLMYTVLENGTEISLRGMTRRDTVSTLPAIGDVIQLALHRDDTVLISAEEP
ncbi:ABC transporter ATP-binding protein [Pelagibius sp. Alg239-R121]|uniref:ABC transporter ATP-binding protein n=1 Tax=Pelagibius sp. Alg239-R121 TaxID=2993448 RepID=UPI0024A69359|nr:ABC transporter ATP-binding protein [Pelagibius sp. Alg239-R121]